MTIINGKIECPSAETLNTLATGNPEPSPETWEAIQHLKWCVDCQDRFKEIRDRYLASCEKVFEGCEDGEIKP